MIIDQFKKAAKGKIKIVNEISNMYMDDCIEGLASEFNVNKTVAKYLLAKALTFNVVKAEIEEQLRYLNENDLIFEDD